MAKTKARGRAAVPIRDILRNNVKEKLKRDEVVASLSAASACAAGKDR